MNKSYVMSSPDKKVRLISHNVIENIYLQILIEVIEHEENITSLLKQITVLSQKGKTNLST